MRNVFIKFVFVVLILQSYSASAAGPIVELVKPKLSPIKAIGIVPIKKVVSLQLGEIRTKNPELPIISTLESRMKKRLRMAHQRQRQVGTAKRSGNEGEIRRGAKKKQAFQPSNNDSQFSDELPGGAQGRPTPFD